MPKCRYAVVLLTISPLSLVTRCSEGRAWRRIASAAAGGAGPRQSGESTYVLLRRRHVWAVRSMNLDLDFRAFPPVPERLLVPALFRWSGKSMRSAAGACVSPLSSLRLTGPARGRRPWRDLKY